MACVCSERSVREAEAGRGGVTLFLWLAVQLGAEIAGRSLPAGDGLGARLRALRARTGESRRRVAIRAGLTPGTVARIEAGAAGHVAAVERLADALGAGMMLIPGGNGQGFYVGPAASSAWDAWATPPDVLERLYVVTGGSFDLDPCSPGRGRSRVRAREHFDPVDDGLAHQWHGDVYMNPPYGRTIGAWVAKAREEAGAGRARMVVALLPARTDTAWWHRDIAGKAHVWLIRKRLSFGDGDAPAPFPSAIVLWGGSDVHRDRMNLAFPDAWHVRPQSDRS